MNAETMKTLTLKDLAELTQQSDEFVAVEHAAWKAALLSHYQCHATSKINSLARKEYLSIAKKLRSSIHGSVVTERHGFCASIFHRGTGEDDLKKAFLAMDVQGGASPLDECQLSSLLLALVADWNFIPLHGCDEEMLVQSAAEAALRHVKSQVICADDFVEWCTKNNETLRHSLKPVRTCSLE